MALPVTNTTRTNAYTDEDARLAALHALALIDGEPIREFESLVALAADMLGCPTALINLVDRDTVWIQASNAPAPRQIGRHDAFCDRTIATDAPVIIPDLSADTRFATTPLVSAGSRFYAGAPIHARDADGVRHAVGTICVLDVAPRSLNAAGEGALVHLATLAESLITARRTAQDAVHIAMRGETLLGALAEKDRIFRQAERIASMGSWRVTLPEYKVEWSENVYRIHDVPVGQQPTIDTALDFYPAAARDYVQAVIQATIDEGKPFDYETDFVTAKGRQIRVRAMGEPEIVDGTVTAIIGVFQDVTDRYRLEQQLRRSADTDALTGIANRAAFDRELERAMTRARRDDTPLLLVLVDLDGFKDINDSLGHDAGDEVLRRTAQALRQPWLAQCHPARIGGDEFALIVSDPALARDPELLRERIEATLRISVDADGIVMTSAGSIGIAALDGDMQSLRDFARRADSDLYAAKRGRVGIGRQRRAREAA